MARFSIGTAIGDAFDLVRRRPLSVFVWGLLLVTPFFISLALLLPTMGDLVANMPAPGENSPDDMMASRMVAGMMQFQLASMLLNIGQMLVAAVVYTAVFRAILRPQERSAFSLRIGMDELRVAVVGLAIGVGLYAAMLLFMVVGLAVGFAVWTAGDAVGLTVAVCVMVLVMLVGLSLALARVSMMAPASVLYRDFAFVQGWRLAAGKTLPLFGMMLVILILILLFEVLLAVAALIVFSGVAAMADFDWTQMHGETNPFAGMNAWIVANWYWAVLGGIVASFLYGVLMTLSIAPFASACRQLDASRTPPVADEHSPAPAG